MICMVVPVLFSLRCGFAAVLFLELQVRIPLESWKSVSCECFVLSGRGLCVGLITRPEASYRLRCVVVCGLGTLTTRKPGPTRAVEP